MRKAILACLFLVFLLAACSPKDDAASIEGTELKTHQAKATVTNITETDDDIEITVYEEKFDTNVTFVKRKDKLDENSPIRSYKEGDVVDVEVNAWEYVDVGTVARVTMRLLDE